MTAAEILVGELCWRIESKALGRKNSYATAAGAAIAGIGLVTSVMLAGPAFADGPTVADGSVVDAKPTEMRAAVNQDEPGGPGFSNPQPDSQDTREGKDVAHGEKDQPAPQPDAQPVDPAAQPASESEAAEAAGAAHLRTDERNPANTEDDRDAGRGRAGYYALSSATSNFCDPGDSYWIESGSGSVEAFTLRNDRITGGPIWMGSATWHKKRNTTGTGSGYDALAVDRKHGRIFFADHATVMSAASGNKSYVTIVQATIAPNTLIQTERIKVVGAGMPFKGGTMDNQGRYYVFAGDVTTSRSAQYSDIKVMAYDTVTRRVLTLGQFSAGPFPAARTNVDLLFDNSNQLYVMVAATEGTRNIPDPNGAAKIDIYRVDFNAASRQAQGSAAELLPQKAEKVSTSAGMSLVPAWTTNGVANAGPLSAKLVHSAMLSRGPEGVPFGGGMGRWAITGFLAGQDGNFYVSANHEGNVEHRAGRPRYNGIFKVDFERNVLVKVLEQQKSVNLDRYNFRFGSPITDMEGCVAAVPTIRAAKDVVSRAGDDQFRISVKKKNGGQQASAITSGRARNRAAVTDSLLRFAGSTYLVEEEMATTSSLKLSAYQKSVTCTDSKNRSVRTTVVADTKERYAVELSAGSYRDVSCTVRNELRTGSITAVKHDHDSYAKAGARDEASMPPEARLAGVGLQLCRDVNNNGTCEPNEQRIGGVQSTDRQGEASWQNLPVGDYVIVEPHAPNGYQRFAGLPVRVSGGTQSPIRVLVPNSRVKGKITWTKVDASNGKPLGGSIWQINGNDNSPATSPKHRVIRHTTIADCNAANSSACKGPDKDPRAGHFALQDMGWGTYFLREIKAPTGYKLSRQVHRADLYANQGRANIALGNIKNEKQDVPPLPLTGGVGSDMFYLAGGIVAALSLGLAGWLFRKRKFS